MRGRRMGWILIKWGNDCVGLRHDRAFWNGQKALGGTKYKD